MLSRQNTTGCFAGVGIFDILRDGGFADHQGGDRYVRTAMPVDPTPAEFIYQQLIQDYPLYTDTHCLLHVTGSQFAECLTGAADPIRLLFGKSKALFQGFYTNTPMSVAASKLLITLLRSIFPKIARERNRSIEILEVGAGLGGTTQFVLRSWKPRSRSSTSLLTSRRPSSSRPRARTR
jgi:hypothetical protein